MARVLCLPRSWIYCQDIPSHFEISIFVLWSLLQGISLQSAWQQFHNSSLDHPSLESSTRGQFVGDVLVSWTFTEIPETVSEGWLFSNSWKWTLIWLWSRVWQYNVQRGPQPSSPSPYTGCLGLILFHTASTKYLRGLSSLILYTSGFKNLDTFLYFLYFQDFFESEKCLKLLSLFLQSIIKLCSDWKNNF